MARSISSAKLLSAAVTRAITNGRGFSAAAAATAGKATPGNAATSGMVKKTGEAGNKVSTSWVPDPRTGFYRPENVAEEIDAAELRALLLKKH
ncbi:unnamed protein product [Linum tenue]|uniref:Uncharacterized protein n=1 Tax=Linum tenue TaxID=586396 RepID=A0AAV0ID52_9ROSI|nr:unnamed protein product [Linum tenue]